MALLDFDKGRITRTPNPVDRVTTAKKRQSTWQRTGDRERWDET